MRWLAVSAFVAVMCGSSISTADAQEYREPTPWDQGRISLSFGIGTVNQFDERYIAASLGGGYYVLPGLELSMQGERWFGGDPSVTKVRPRVRYVLHQLRSSVKPFADVFYTRWFVSDQDAIDSVGARLGVVLFREKMLTLSIAGTVERVVSECSGGCTAVYPELLISLGI